MQRRSFLQGAMALGPLAAALSGCASTPKVPENARVVVIGGGFGGATAAKYVRLLSEHRIDVVLIEPDAEFISCPLSNLVIGGSKTLAELRTPYDELTRRHGVQRVHDLVTAMDAQRKTVTLARGASIRYDKLVLSPGVELMLDALPGLPSAQASGQVLQAWKAGPETLALRRQLEAMPDGGVFAITIPEAPYRCPPGPYERASQVASYFKQAKPRAKVLILDANPEVTSKPALFKKFWAEHYGGMLEYRPNHKVVAVDAASSSVKLELQDDVRADVLNVLPPMRAGRIATQTGLANAGERWCGVNYLNFESAVARDVHIIGDATLGAPFMPKSGHMANGHAKVAAAAIVAELSGWPVNPAPLLTNTCYSFVDASRVIHVASVHQYVAAEKTYRTPAGSGGLSSAPSELEGRYAWSWAQNIWADSLL